MNRLDELRQYFHNAYGMETEWPKTFEVSAELYGRACQFVFDQQDLTKELYWDVVKDGKPQEWLIMKNISLGPNRGIMFKNVELIIKKETNGS